LEPLEEYKKPYKERVALPPDSTLESSNVFTTICCPQCDEPIPAKDLNIHDKIGKCGSCNIVFSFRKNIQALDDTPQKVRQELFRPEGVDIFYYKDEVEFGFNQPDGWIEWAQYLFLFAFMPLGVAIYLKKGTDITQLLALLLPTVLSIIYFIFRQKHKTFIGIDDRFLWLKNRPKKFKKDQSFLIEHIDQVYVKQRPDFGTWDVKMIVDEGQGQKHMHMTTVRTISQAKYLEQEIERYLGIQDAIVPEETK